MNHDSFSRWTVTLSVCACGLVALANVLIDPYGVLREGAARPGPAHNMRAHHMRQILSMPVKPKSLLLGNSVMGLTDPLALPGVGYNASFFMATVRDLHVFMELLESNDALPSELVVGLDPFLFSTGRDTSELDAKLTLDEVKHKATWKGSMEYRFPVTQRSSQWDSLRWHADALYGAGLYHLFSTALDRLGKTPAIDYTAQGNYLLPLAARAMQMNPEQHHGKLPRLASNPKHRVAVMEADQLASLAQLHQWLGKRKIRTTWVLQPTSQWFDRMHEAGQIDRYYAQMTTALPVTAKVVDARRSLSGLSGQAMHWYDLKHYTPSVSALVLREAL